MIAMDSVHKYLSPYMGSLANSEHLDDNISSFAIIKSIGKL